MRSFPLFPAALLLHAPRSARRLSCRHSCGGSPKRTRQYARWYRREAYLPWNKGADDCYISGNSLDTAKAKLVPVSQAPTGAALRGHVHSVNNQRKTTTASFTACQFLQYYLHTLTFTKGQTVQTVSSSLPVRSASGLRVAAGHLRGGTLRVQSPLRGKMSFIRADQVLRGPRSVIFLLCGLKGETEITTQQAHLPQR
jgi:hypothetical protein